MMNIKFMRAGGLLVAVAGLMLASGCIVEPRGRVIVAAPGPVVVAPAPPPPPEPVYVPDDYVWDGYEYVGVVGDQCFYLGPGNVWLVCEPFRLERFHGWERYHRDWRVHAIRNDRFRSDRYGHYQPRRGEPARRRDDRH
ncbi:MAG TPA: hypothetical protein VH597_05125 [Verrucomicrobiae bacterium]|jgi:hypothetical protein|nr:hypothetical protein [Verrucomicrobiae bacterium]